MMLKYLKKLSLFIFTICLSGCMVGPDYKPVAMQMPNKYKEAPKGWKIAEPKDAMDKGKWWLVFNDPVLNNLIEQVNVSNQNIALAVAQYQQALATIDQTKANLWPTLVLDLSSSRQKTASNLQGVITRSSIGNTYEINPNATWSPDIFGAVRRAVDASVQGAQATEAQLADTRLSMQALLAQTYFQLRCADISQKFLDETVAAYRKTLELTKNQYAAGTVSKLDVVQSESQLQSAQAAALDNGINRAQYEHSIAVLLGKTPEEFSLSTTNADIHVPFVPLELPAQLLERRSDVAAAERNVAQANSNIGVAVAAYFPTLTLTSGYGYQSTAFREVFSYPALMWSIGAAVAETIFDGGSRAAAVNIARATYEQKVATYRQTVLTALQNVEDNLASVRILDSEALVQKAAVDSANKALDITVNQYNSGIIPYTEVLVAQNTAYAAKNTEIGIYSRQLVATVGLIQALGGGWSVDELGIEKPQETKNDCK
jgi:NodT family efflux transporter outer membrane factor (OMF) lipoprotein